MQIRNKYYPYPVIATGNDSYEGSEFSSDIDYAQDAYNIRFTLKAFLKDDYLLSLLNAGAVKYAHHIECPQTCFRQLYLTDKEVDQFVVHESRLNGQTQICTFLVAAQDIPQYSNPSFSPDFKGFKFNIDRGCVLAIGNQVNILIDKEKETLSNTSSIFCIKKNYDPTVSELQVNDTSNKIVILIPERTCNQYLNIASSSLMPILHAMIIQPALMQVLLELKEAAQKDALYLYEDLRWYRSLKKTAKKLKIDFDDDSISSLNVFETTQKFLDTPVVKAMDVLCSGEDDSND